MAARQEVTFIISARDQTRAVFAGLRNRVKRLRTSINSLAGRLAGALGAGIIVRGVKRTAEAIDDVAKAAKRVGVGVGFLSRFAFAAQLAGTDLRTLERGLKNLNRTSAEAVLRGGATAEAFEHIGLNAEKMLELDPATRFLAVATALGDMQNEATRTNVAQQLLGRAGSDLVPLFDQIADNLEETATAAEGAGAVFDEDLSEKAENFVDQLTILNQQLEVFYQQLLKIASDRELLSGLGDILELAGRAARFGLDVGDVIGTAAGAATTGVAGAVERLEGGGFSQTEITLRDIRLQQEALGKISAATQATAEGIRDVGIIQ